MTVPGVCESLYQPSVTSIIGKLDKSNALVGWAVGQMYERLKQLMGQHAEWDRDSVLAVAQVAKDSWRKSKEEAADIGSLAHRHLEAILLGEAPQRARLDRMLAPGFSQDMIDQADNAIDAGLQFIREHEIEVVQAETARWSPTYGFIGTGDLIARIDGKLSVLDWKTSKKLYPTVRLQLSAYQQAYEEEFPEQQIRQRVAVNIGKDGVLTVEWHGDETHDADLAAFLALLEVWRWDRS